jgi:alpha-tubulin suppressor-like RCC1 family protein
LAGSRLYRQIDAGINHSCALSLADEAFCWGAAVAIGDGKNQDRAVPTRVAGGLKFTRLSTGWDHTCAVTSDRQTYCWGAFITGQVNGSGPLSSAVPKAVLANYPFAQISVGEHLACGIRANGATWCWGLGWNQDGRPHSIHALK